MAGSVNLYRRSRRVRDTSSEWTMTQHGILATTPRNHRSTSAGRKPSADPLA